MQPKYITPAMVALILGVTAGSADAQVVVDGGEGNLNQIEGTVTFASGSVLPTPVGALQVSTISNHLNPARTASTSANVSTGAYAVTVLADDEDHTVSVVGYSDSSRDVYRFASKVSDPVPNEPAPAVSLSFSECSGAVRINFVEDSSGAPATVQHMWSNSRSETSAGSGQFAGEQASTNAPSTSSEIYPVLGDGLLHRVNVDFRVGGIIYNRSFDAPIACGETAEFEIRLDELEVIEPGGIRGTIDLRFQTENPNTTMWAVSGPYGNYGNDQVVPGFGEYEILNLVPSTVVDPSQPYFVYGQMSFPTLWGSEWFQTPRLLVNVPEGTIVDLSNRYIMDEGFLRGQVELTGPLSCMNRINGAGNLVRMQMGGASASSTNGYAYQDLTGNVIGVPHAAQYNSAYRLAVGTPDNVPGNWRPSLYVSNRDPSNNNLVASYTFQDQNAGAPLIGPGDDVLVNMEHCVVPVQAELEINGALAVGSTFNNPRMNFSGSYQDDDDYYTVGGNANGLPTAADTRGTTGEVPLCMPAGDYIFDTVVSAESEGGLISDTTLLREDAPVECGAWIVPFYFDVDVSEVQCAGGDLEQLPFEMTAKSLGDGGRPEHAYVWVNGGPDAGGELIDLCGGSAADCPDSSEFSFTFDVDTSALAQCGNELEVYVLSKSGKLSKSAVRSFDFEQHGPSGPGCEDVVLDLDPVTNKATLDLYQVSSQLNECGLGLEADTVCVVYDSVNAQTIVTPVEEGSTLELSAGAYEGQCYVTTGCGFRSCSFDATAQ